VRPLQGRRAHRARDGGGNAVRDIADPPPRPRPADFPYGGTMEFLRELWGFLRVRKKFWLLPIILVLLLFGVLVVLTSGTAVAPFIYTLF
jgi:hypothetical protein